MLTQIRSFLVLFAALATTACSYGSMVDVAPLKERPSRPPLASGDYCEVSGETAPFTIISSTDCIPIEWQPAERVLLLRESQESDDITTAAIVSLGSGAFIAQITDTTGPVPHQISLFLAKGDAFALLPVLDGPAFDAVAARHAGVSFNRDGSGSSYIAAGKLADIHRFLRDIARASLRKLMAEDDPLTIGIRDTMGAPDHAARKSQTRDIEALQRAASKLAR